MDQVSKKNIHIASEEREGGGVVAVCWKGKKEGEKAKARLKSYCADRDRKVGKNSRRPAEKEKRGKKCRVKGGKRKRR